MVEAVIYTQKGDFENTGDIERQLEIGGIDYKIISGRNIVSERHLPVIRMDGELLEGTRQLFNYLAHKNGELTTCMTND